MNEKEKDKDSLENLSKFSQNSPYENSMGREIGLLSGSTTRRRGQTFNYLIETGNVGTHRKRSNIMSERDGTPP